MLTSYVALNMLMGVSLDFVRKFVDDNSQMDGFAELSTAAVFTSIIKPAVAERHCAYVDLYQGHKDGEKRLFVCPANVLVSHAWSCLFSDVVDVMEQ